MKLIFFGAGFCSKFILERLEGFDEIICTHNLELTSQPFDEKLKIKRMTFSEFYKNHNSFFSGATHLLNSIPPIRKSDLVKDFDSEKNKHTIMTSIEKSNFESI